MEFVTTGMGVCVEVKVVSARCVQDCRSILCSNSTRYLPIITLLRVYTDNWGYLGQFLGLFGTKLGLFGTKKKFIACM